MVHKQLLCNAYNQSAIACTRTPVPSPPPSSIPVVLRFLETISSHCIYVITWKSLPSSCTVYIMADDKSNKALLERFELLKGAEHHKNALIEVSRDCRFLLQNRSFFSLQKDFGSSLGPTGYHRTPEFKLSILTSDVLFRSFCTDSIQSLYNTRGNTLT